MFQRLYELSQCLPSREPWERLNEGMPPIYDRGLAVCFDDQGRFSGVETYQGNRGVVYRSGPPNGTDLTPCCKLAAVTAKTVRRVAEGARRLLEVGDLPAERRNWLTASLHSYDADTATIAEAVEAAIPEAGIDGKNHRGYLYWARSVAEPVHAWPEARQLLVDRFLESFADGGQRTGTCCVCGRGERTVYGNFSVLACYNLDKPGSIAGGFHKSRAHRNFPVCGDCALALGDGVVFAETHLKSTMAGQSYLILPYSNSPEVTDQLADSLRRHPERFHLAGVHDLVAAELALVDDFEGQRDQLALHLVFFEAKNAAWRIRAEVQELLPSRLRALHDAGRQLADAPDLSTVNKTETRPLAIGAGTFRQFAGGDDTLRAWLAALFRDETVDEAHFLHQLVVKLVNTARADANLLRWMTLQAWGLYRYARLTGLILPPTFTEDTVQDAIPHSAYGRYVRAHQDFFNRPELVVAFLTGCYMAQVASVQRQERGADPFTRKFMGRLLNRTALQRLYREGHGKLAQYGKLGYVITSLDPDLAAAWVACGDDWAISEDRATFAFTLGYSLAYRIGQLSAPDKGARPDTGTDTDTNNDHQE